MVPMEMARKIEKGRGWGWGKRRGERKKKSAEEIDG